MSDKTSLVETYRSQQQQYNYYIIALSVTCVGFSATITMSDKLTVNFIPLGIAIIFWLTSIFCGLRFVQWSLSSIYANIALLDVMDGIHDMTGTDTEKIKTGTEILKKILTDNSAMTSKLGKIQNLTFYFGVLAFLVWRILMMI